MTLTKKDLQSIKGIVHDVVHTEIHDAIQASEERMKEFVRSEFRIQNIDLDTRFRAIDARFEALERKMDTRFKPVEAQLQDHEERITALE